MESFLWMGGTFLVGWILLKRPVWADEVIGWLRLKFNGD